jgi:hypothetical protein
MYRIVLEWVPWSEMQIEVPEDLPPAESVAAMVCAALEFGERHGLSAELVLALVSESNEQAKRAVSN